MPNRRDVQRWQQGFDQWNEWAASKEAGAIDLSGLQQDGSLNFEGFVFPGDSNFAGIRSKGPVTFKNCRFIGDSKFHKAQGGSFDFSSCEFDGAVNFTELHCTRGVDFRSAKFASDVIFKQIQLPNSAVFTEAWFGGSVLFDEVHFQNEAGFSTCQFDDNTIFRSCKISSFILDKSRFQGQLEFDGNRFDIKCSLNNLFFEEGNFSLKGNNQIICDIDLSNSHFSGLFSADNLSVGGHLDLHHCKFQSAVDLTRAKLQNGVDWTGCEFGETAVLSVFNAEFRDQSIFRSVIFGADVHFDGAKFEEGYSDFTDVEFRGLVSFDHCEFTDHVVIRDANFAREASFRGITTNSEFDLAGTEFRVVPDFLFARFAEPPSFEGVRIGSPLQRSCDDDRSPDPRGWFLKLAKLSQNPTISQRYRKLKALAILGHDHRQEIDFFAGEIQAKRFWHDKFGSLPFATGFFYQIVSDFGRSALRPFLFWLATILAYCVIYAEISVDAARTVMITLYLQSVSFSFVQSLPFLFWSRDGATKNLIRELFGKDDLPTSVMIIAISQNILCTFFIFLFFLALRNQFKIR